VRSAVERRGNSLSRRVVEVRFGNNRAGMPHQTVSGLAGWSCCHAQRRD
jgi:hypothetical protein